MSAPLPAKLREAQLGQFARRATQLERFKPIITYWLRFYITQKVLSKGLHNGDPQTSAYTAKLMDTLEQTKAEHPTEDALVDDMAAQAYCEQFALQTFEKGDKDIRNNKVTEGTADTLLAATTFLDMLSIWNDPPEPEIKSKMTYAKYHFLRIAKAIKANEDPNLSNPKQETPPAAQDSDFPGVQTINEGEQQPPHNPYQPYAESAPSTSAQPSPSFPPARGPPTPPLNLPSAPTGYNHNNNAAFPHHQDVSPISQPAKSRQGSEVSIGGGYFPRLDVPTFTADDAPTSLPTAPSMLDEPMTTPYDASPVPPPTGPSPQPPQAPNPQSFYQTQPPPLQQPIPQAPHHFQPQQAGYGTPPPSHIAQQAPHSQASPIPPWGQQYAVSPQQYATPPPPQPPVQTQPPQAYAQPVAPLPQTSHQGLFNSDEESVLEAQKHAKWAISALNFEDVNTAVKELKIALQALGAS